MKKILLASTMLVGLATAASAADFGSPPPPISANWTGFYVGAHAGWLGTTNSVRINQFVGGGDGFNLTADRSGFNGGLFAGYNLQMQQIVLGLDADIGFGPGATVGNSTFTVINAVGGTGTVGVRAGLNWNAHLRARAGLALGQFMPFFAAGLALSEERVGHVVRAGDAITSTIVGTRTVSRTGYSLGVGGEFMFTRNMIGRLEYIFDDYGAVSFASNPGPGINASTTRSRLTTNTARAGLSYRF